MSNNTYDYKTIKLEEMVDYIEKNAPQDKAWFKKIAYADRKTKEGTKKVYNHLKAKKAFCEKYMPEIIPVAKEPEPKASDILLNW